jgi:hypothetical protein
MSTITYKYQNTTGYYITEAHKKNAKQYWTITYENGIRVKEELTSTDVSNTFVIIWGKPGQTYNQLYQMCNTYFTTHHSVQINIYTEQQNNYTQYEYYFWIHQVLKQRGKLIFNQQYKTMCEAVLDPSNGNLIETRKKFYANQFEDEPKDVIFRFSYDADGNLRRISDEQMQFDSGWGVWAGAKIENEFKVWEEVQEIFNWDDHPYFHTGTFGYPPQ